MWVLRAPTFSSSVRSTLVNRLPGYLRFCGAVGRGHSLKRERLAKQMHISVRRVKKLAEESRLAGVPILYNTDSRRGGIYLAENEVRKINI